MGKFKKISERASQEEFVKIGQLVQKKLAKFRYFSVEGNTGYFFYEILEE